MNCPELHIYPDLIADALNGSEDAFAELVNTYRHSVYNLAYQMLGDVREAEDATQEAFLRAYRSLHRYDRERSFKTWLLTITSNYCIDLIRKWRLHTILPIDETFAYPESDADEADPEDTLIRSERDRKLNHLLATLSPEARATVVMHYWYDMGCADIAEVLHTSESAVKSRLFRARQMMAEHMQTREVSALRPADLRAHILHPVGA